jgi:transcription termination factor NusB
VEGIVATSVMLVAAAVILAALPRPVMAALHVEETATAAMLLVKESIHRFINTILSRFLKVLVLPKIGRS